MPMADLFVRSLISLILSSHLIDAVVLNCTVYPMILQWVPNQIVATIAVANSSNEEIFWSHVDFPEGLHIYKVPRNAFDYPLWSADSVDKLQRDTKPNSIVFLAFSDCSPDGSCLMGVIIQAQHSYYDLMDTKLDVKVGSMPSISLPINSYIAHFPILFLITDIPASQMRNSTLVNIVISGGKTIRALTASRPMEPTLTAECATVLLRASHEPSMNLTITMSAYVFTSIPLMGFAVTYRVYLEDYLFYEESEVVDTLEFPFTTQRQLGPLTHIDNYTIDVIIFGPLPGFTSDVTIFQGATTARLRSCVDNNVRISLLYTGPKIGTAIVGTIHQALPNQGTWPLTGSNLAIVVDNPSTQLSKSAQFIIFDQTFPIEFTMLDVKEINSTNQTITFTVTITYLDGTVIWEAITTYDRIIIGQLNKVDVGVLVAGGYGCQTPGKGYCSRLSPININQTCCSQFKCSHGTCHLS